MIAPWELVLRLAVAAILGALVGLERERLEWAAGMRTHALVSLGSALFMVVSIFGFSDILNERHVILDPSRVAAQVASGIGFIGAGTIIFRREVVKGLTTAASIWAVAAVGLAVGGGMFLAAVSATLLCLALLVLAKPLKARMFPNRKEARRVRLVVERGTPLAELRERDRGIGGAPGAHRGPPELGRRKKTTRSWSWARAAGQEELTLAYGRATPGLWGARGELRPDERFGGVEAQAVAQPPNLAIQRSAWRNPPPPAWLPMRVSCRLNRTRSILWRLFGPGSQETVGAAA